MKNHFSLINFFALFFLTFLFILPTPTFAQGVRLKISPSLIRIEAKPPADVWTPFTIENQSDQLVSLKIGYKTFDPQASSNGTVVFLKDSGTIPGQDKKIFDKMQIVDDQNISHDSINLGPQQKIRLRLRVLIPESEPQSDYYFSLIFLQTLTQLDQNSTIDNIENQKSYSNLEAGIGINVLLAIGNKETPQAFIEDFSTPWFSSAGPVPFNITVRNSGNHFIVSKGEILIKNMFGQTIGKVLIPSSIILAGTARTFDSKKLNTAFGNTNSSNMQPDLIWSESFLLGVYTATLYLNLSDKGSVYERSIHFVGFPFILLIEIIVVIVLIGYIYLRVKRKLS